MRYAFLFFISIVLHLNSSSQKILINGFAGLSSYQGDLQESFVGLSQVRTAIGFGISYLASDHISVRTGVTFATVTADDKINNKVAYRNLNFTSGINEIHIALEYYLFSLDERKLSPYIFAGIAGYHFNPYTKDTSGTKYYLQPLSTEGQGFYQNRKPYSLNQFAIPIGAGIKMAVTDNIYVGVETGIRKLFTDYLDDVSTTYADPNLILANRGAKALELAYRGGEVKAGASYPTGLLKRGEAARKDLYLFTGITISLRLNNKQAGQHRTGTKSSRRQTNCPTRVL